MKDRSSDKFWFPWWPDKWIFGSVRIEFSPAERGIWVDMLSLASKDDGHIRANEETPYPIQQLAGMLIIPEEILKSAIEKFIETTKLTRTEAGTLYVTKWDKYQFSVRHKSRIDKEMSENSDTMAEKKDAIIKKSKENNNNKIEHDSNFEVFWKYYPRKHEKIDAFDTWKRLKVTQKAEVLLAIPNYAKECSILETEKHMIKHPKTFLNPKKERWVDYLPENWKEPKPKYQSSQVGKDKKQYSEKEKSDQTEFLEFRKECEKKATEKYQDKIDKARETSNEVDLEKAHLLIRNETARLVNEGF